MYDAWEIAKHLILTGYSPECPEESVCLCPLRLQKLLYYCQGWHLGMFGRPLFRQRVEAWTNGPVVKDVYAKFAGSKDPIRPEGIDPPAGPLPESTAALVRMVWGEYARYRPGELVRMTHAEPAWREARGGLPENSPSSAELSHDTMARHFRGVARTAVPASRFPTPDPAEVWQADAEVDEHPERLVPLRDAIARAKARRPV
jgi:uncharacterized phage-associated protein